MGDGKGGCVKGQSITAQFDDLIRCMKVLTDPAEYKFLEFVEGEDERCKRTRSLEMEIQRLQEQVNQDQRQIKNLDLKLKNARLLLDVEKGRRISAETEKNDLANQIGLVMELLGRGQVNETREKLQQLQSSFTYSSSNLATNPNGRRSLKDPISPGPLSTITEDHDSADTILNVSQMDLTEEDELDESKLRSGRPYKRKSISPDRNEAQGTKRRSDHERGDRRSGHERERMEGERSERKSGHEVTTQVTYYATGENIAKVRTEVEVSAPQIDTQIIEQSPDKPTSMLSKPPHTPRPNAPRRPHAPQPPPPHTPQQQSVVQSYSTPTPHTPHTPQTPIIRTYSTSKINTRTHAFYRKTVYKSEHCQPCGMRIKFGKIALKCRDCRATCHQECREMVPLPCVPAASTPTTKGHLGSIADYTPANPPMVPAIVIHCCNEVERRGLSEVGIYRVSGAEKEVKELKERFLRGKGPPNLSQCDVHAISGCLKYFLRSLKEPLITHLLWKDFINAADGVESQDCTASLYQAISELPQPNRDTLAFIILHLQRIAECPECKMPASNLAKVFGPTLVGYSVLEPDPSTMVMETRQQQLVMEKLLDISCDYWNSFTNINDENVYNTPEHGGSLLGGMPASNKRRRSLLSHTPLHARDTPRNQYFRK